MTDTSDFHLLIELHLNIIVRGWTDKYPEEVQHKETHIYLPNPTTCAGCDTSYVFKRSVTCLNSEFSFT